MASVRHLAAASAHPSALVKAHAWVVVWARRSAQVKVRSSEWALVNKLAAELVRTCASA